MESVHFVPDKCANFASHFSSVKIFQIDLFNFASHFIGVQIFQIYFSLKNEKILFPPSHYNFCIVHWRREEDRVGWGCGSMQANGWKPRCNIQMLSAEANSGKTLGLDHFQELSFIELRQN